MLAALVLLAFFAVDFFAPNAATLLKRGRLEFERGSYSSAQDKFKKAFHLSKKSSGVRCEAGVFYATSFVREGRFKEGAWEFRRFIKEYPNSYWTPQAYYDLAYCEINLGNWESAFQIYKKIIRDFPTSTWAGYAKERLEEFKDKFEAY